MSKIMFLAKMLIKATTAHANQQYYEMEIANNLRELGIDPNSFEYELLSRSYHWEDFIRGGVPLTIIESILEEMSSKNNYFESYEFDDNYEDNSNYWDAKIDVDGEDLELFKVSFLFTDLLDKDFGLYDYETRRYEKERVKYLIYNVPSHILKKAIVDVKRGSNRVPKNYDKNWAKELCYILNNEELTILFNNLFNKKLDENYDKFSQVQYLVASVPKEELLFSIEFLKTTDIDVVMKKFKFAYKLNQKLTKDSLKILFKELLNKEVYDILTDEINMCERTSYEFDQLRQVRYLIDCVAISKIESIIKDIQKNNPSIINDDVTDKLRRQPDYVIFKYLLNVMLNYEDLNLLYDKFLCKNYDFNSDKSSQIDYLSKYVPNNALINFINQNKGVAFDDTIFSDYLKGRVFRHSFKWINDYNFSNKSKHYEDKIISFNYPDNYLLANIPENAPDCVVALSRDDRLCDVMVEVSKDSKINYVEKVFEKKYREYIEQLGFYNFHIFEYPGLRTYVQAYSNTDKGVVKSTVYWDFRYKKDVRITLNTLKLDYDSLKDLIIMGRSVEYKKKFLGIF